jgi:aspartate/methionine/tyrosine aminotransferase
VCTSAKDASGWEFCKEELKKAINENTKMILINNPHNPTGKVFSKEELSYIASLVRNNNRIIIVTDEVYEFMIYDEKSFTRFCTLEGMWDRTLTISSAGKLFSVTGWKIGWIYGPVHLMHSVALCSQFAWFSVNTPAQEAISQALSELKFSNYLQEFVNGYAERRTKMMDALKGGGFNPILPQSTFFCLVDLSNCKNIKNIANYVKSPETQLNWNDKPLDWNFCRWLTAEIGVTAIPCSSFFFGSNPPTNLIRFAFCKSDSELERAKVLLKDLTKTYQLE